MAAEHEKVSTERLYIHRCVGNRLCTIDQYRYLVSMRNVNDALHIVDGTKRVVHMPY